MQSDSLLLYPKQATTCPCPEPDQSTPRILMLQFHPWIWNQYHEICSVLGYSAWYSGNSLPTPCGNLQGSTNPRGFLDLFTDRLSRNVGKELLPHDVLYPRRAQISFTSRRKPEITEPIISPKRRWPSFQPKPRNIPEERKPQVTLYQCTVIYTWVFQVVSFLQFCITCV